ncbi:Tms1 protein [Saccharomycopsis crataegensis]|uniref:Tms1 protein n=1 Tax=Saccharomycopsis crataegensis TaxID=43959 RepID=A0AAV5QLX5_9ASCO|nr:Tms1 protein [Saccharomycopsis crataegensis]
MGAALSIPLIPVQMAGTWVASCLGAACCSAFTNTFNTTFSSSIATRILYALIFLVNSILSWIMLSKWAVRKLETLTFGLIKASEGANFFGVQRINFALAVFHLSLALLLVNVKSTKNSRAKIQNGIWPVKLFFWGVLLVISFLIPDKFYELYGNYIALIGALLFNLIGLILLVDFAHEWSEICLEHIQNESYSSVRLDIEGDYEEYDSEGSQGARFWTFLLVGGTALMYIATLVLTIIMYIFFANKGCSLNQAFITVNVICAIIVTLLSVDERIRDANPSNGLGQSGMVCVYCTYLILSACCSAPDGSCNPVVRSTGTKTVSIVMSAIFTFMAIAYTTTRAATNSAFSHDAKPNHGIASPPSSVITTQPGPVDDIRIQTIRQAVEEGALPPSALDDPSWYYDDSDAGEDDEAFSTKYNYFIFHFIFLLATQFIATLLTMNVKPDDLGDFVPVGRTNFYSIMKMVSALICYALYSWSLIAPVVFPDRFAVSI